MDSEFQPYERFLAKGFATEPDLRVPGTVLKRISPPDIFANTSQSVWYLCQLDNEPGPTRLVVQRMEKLPMASNTPDNVESEPIRAAFRQFRDIMRGIPEEHFTDQCMWWLVSQMDRMERELREAIRNMSDGKGEK